MKNGNKRKISPNIIRVWFDTVITPIINGLEDTLNLLKTEDYTWKYLYRLFYEIKRLDEYLDNKYRPNYEQVIQTEFIELADLTKNYNEKLNIFNKSCNDLYLGLINSSSLKKLLIELIDKYEKFSEISQLDADYLRRSDTIKWGAEYIINNWKELPEGNVLKIIWNNNWKSIFEILESDDLKPVVIELINNRDIFTQTVIETLKIIKEFRMETSLKYSVPIIM